MSSKSVNRPKAGIRTVGSQQILLTEAETRCFYIARDYQRKSLRRALLPLDLQQWRAGFNRLGWSKTPLVLTAQCLILLLAFVPMLVWLLGKSVVSLIAFPFRYAQTFFVPKDLNAPGEKTLVGIHNAFNRHLNLSASDYVACINDWIKVLYGEEASRRLNFDQAIKVEINKKINQHANSDLAATTRSMVAVMREKVSKELGHYGKARGLH